MWGTRTTRSRAREGATDARGPAGRRAGRLWSGVLGWQRKRALAAARCERVDRSGGNRLADAWGRWAAGCWTLRSRELGREGRKEKEEEGRRKQAESPGLGFIPFFSFSISNHTQT